MDTLEAAIAIAEAWAGKSTEPKVQPVPKQCKECTRRRGDGFCKKTKKHVARRKVACTKFRDKEK